MLASVDMCVKLTVLYTRRMGFAVSPVLQFKEYIVCWAFWCLQLASHKLRIQYITCGAYKLTNTLKLSVQC